MATLYKRKGSKFYYASIYVEGKRRRFGTGCTVRKDAQAKADEEESRLQQELELKDSLTLKQAGVLFFTRKGEDYAASTLKDYKRGYVNTLRILGNRPLASMGLSDIKHYVKERGDETSEITIRRELSALSSIFKFAMKRDPKIEQNPVRLYDSSSLSDAKQRKVWLEKEDIERLLKACQSDTHRLFIMLAVDTGMRSQEMLQLTVNEINWNEKAVVLGNIEVSRTKTRQGRRIPLTDRTFCALEDYVRTHKWSQPPKHTTDFIFENPRTRKPITSVKRFWAGACKRAGLKNVRIHDLRHTFASRGLQAGVPTVTMMELTGHQSVASYKRYAHGSKRSHEAAINMIEND